MFLYFLLIFPLFHLFNFLFFLFLFFYFYTFCTIIPPANERLIGVMYHYDKRTKKKRGLRKEKTVRTGVAYCCTVSPVQ